MKPEITEIPSDKIWIEVHDQTSAIAAWLELRSRATTSDKEFAEPDCDLV